jgi:biotin synthase-related radical SAM superfamily protein
VLPAGIARSNVSVAITIYESTTTPQWKERFVMVDKRNGRVIQEAFGSGRWHPDSDREKSPAGTYPNWVIAEVNGTQDNYEQSGRDDLLRIVKK